MKVFELAHFSKRFGSFLKPKRGKWLYCLRVFGDTEKNLGSIWEYGIRCLNNWWNVPIYIILWNIPILTV